MAEMSKEDEIFWRRTLESLRGPMPEVGEDPPKEETGIEVAAEPPELIGGLSPEALGNLSKVTIDIFFFMDQESHKYFMMQSQNMVDYGEVPLRKAVEMAKRKQRRNKG